MIPSVSQYAGEQLLTGQQAEAYADHFIAVHVTTWRAARRIPSCRPESLAQPNNTALAGLVATVFKGETLRSMLLNAYGWWKVSQITYIAAMLAFALGGLALIGLAVRPDHGRHPEIIHETIPATGPKDVTDRLTATVNHGHSTTGHLRPAPATDAGPEVNW